MREGFAMLRSGRSWKRRVTAAAAALVLTTFFLAPTAAFAQAKKKGEVEEVKKGYTMPYFFTLIGIMAAVVPLCMAANREWDFEDEAEEEKK